VAEKLRHQPFFALFPRGGLFAWFHLSPTALPQLFLLQLHNIQVERPMFRCRIASRCCARFRDWGVPLHDAALAKP
jgi:hypothetical protein